MSATLTRPADTSGGTAREAISALLARRPDQLVRTTARIRALCAEIGDPQRTYPTVQVTGTNGKTSVTRMIAALLTAHDVTTGAFTSPHVDDLRERIAVDGRSIDRDTLTATLSRLAPHIARVEAVHGHIVTFFETLTALACAHFAEVGVDVGVFEVGKGGAHDPTRVVDAGVAVLTRVALDHAELGPTPAAVAAEKAGIIVEGAGVISAEQEPAVARVIGRAARRHAARLLLAGRDFDVRGRAADADGQRLDLRAAGVVVPDVWLPLAGSHQADNAACALAAAAVVLRESLDSDAVRAGLASVCVPGRLERLGRPGQAPVVLDGAHNPAAAQALAEGLAADHPHRRRVVVLGVCADKDVGGLVAALAPVADHVVTTTAPSPRAAPAAALAAIARDHGCTVEAIPDLDAALTHAAGITTAADLVVVTGSLYTVAAARAALTITTPPPS